MRGWTATSVALLILSCHAPGFAAEPTLRARAESEIRQSGQTKSHSSDAQLSSSMLRLEDPMPNVRGRTWDYYLKLSVQSFTPSGTGGNDLTNERFSLTEAGSSVMPGLGFGLQADVLKPTTFRLALGLGARLAFSTKKSSAQFSTGFRETDVTLNSTLYSVNPMISLRLARLESLRLNLLGEVGSVNYTQTSTNKLAAFSEHANFYGTGAGLEYLFSSNWSVLIDYLHRQVAGNSPVGLEADNFELGTRVTW